MTELQLLRVEDAARVLAISRSKAYELINRGALPAVRVGSSLRVSRAAIERLVEAGQTEGESAVSVGAK